MLNNFDFKSNMTRNKTFTEKFLAKILSLSSKKIQKITTLLKNTGEIMIYGEENSREYKLEDVYVILTKCSKKEKIKVLNQFKKEFFHD